MNGSTVPTAGPHLFASPHARQVSNLRETLEVVVFQYPFWTMQGEQERGWPGETEATAVGEGHEAYEIAETGG